MEPIVPLPSPEFDFNPYWTFFLLTVRFGALFFALPGIGTDQIPAQFRTGLAVGLALAVSAAGAHAAVPANMAEGGLIIFTEFLLGWLMGFIPSIVVGGVVTAGQVSTGAIGLGQANMIDHSLGESVGVLARFQGLFAALVFLLIDGHHMVIRMAAGIGNDIGVGVFRPDVGTAELLFDRFASSFELALTVCAPVIVTLLVTQFVLGLLTKFVPQINIFIISLPLTIGVGLYIIAFTYPGLARHFIAELAGAEEALGTLLIRR